MIYIVSKLDSHREEPIFYSIDYRKAICCLGTEILCDGRHSSYKIEKVQTDTKKHFKKDTCIFHPFSKPDIEELIQEDLEPKDKERLRERLIHLCKYEEKRKQLEELESMQEKIEIDLENIKRKKLTQYSR